MSIVFSPICISHMYCVYVFRDIDIFSAFCREKIFWSLFAPPFCWCSGPSMTFQRKEDTEPADVQQLEDQMRMLNSNAGLNQALWLAKRLSSKAKFVLIPQKARAPHPKIRSCHKNNQPACQWVEISLFRGNLPPNGVRWWHPFKILFVSTIKKQWEPLTNSFILTTTKLGFLKKCVV